MKNIAIIYWSGTGNTEAMAELIAQGAKDAGASVDLRQVSTASPKDVEAADVVLLGCPSMGDEVLEESEFEPFVASIETLCSDKSVGLFGSYGWGDGQWMRDWAQRMIGAGAQLLDDGLIVGGAPAGADADNCVAFGQKAAS